MDLSRDDEICAGRVAIDQYTTALAVAGISLCVQQDFATYCTIRRAHGDVHLNQAFDPVCTRFGGDDFWLLAENQEREAVGTYCQRRFVVADFCKLIRSQVNIHNLVDPRSSVKCEIPAFGGEVTYGGGLWVRKDYRGSSRLALILPRFARAVALQNRRFDHDSGMIRNDPGDSPRVAGRKAVFLGTRIYGFARVHRLVHGWFPPENRNATLHLCHAARVEAIASLVAQIRRPQRPPLRRVEFRDLSLVYANKQLVNTLAVRR